MAEIIKFHLVSSHKGIIDVHNYPQTNKVSEKVQNWENLNRKVLSKLNCKLSKHQIQEIS